MRRGMIWVVIVVAILSLLLPRLVTAAEPTNSGLLISPPRFSMKVDAGGVTSQSITVANHTPRALDVALSVQEFSVANLSYEYQIKPVDNPWLSIEQTFVHLDSGKDQSLTFSVRPPANTAPGGKYYLIVASATSKNGALMSTMQVAAPVYIAVNGDLDTSSRLLSNHSISHLIIGDSIPFQLSVENTGNVHYPIDVKGSLRGLFTSQSTVSTQHILLPNTTRLFRSSIPAPILPGIYQAVYGYSSSTTGDILVSAWVLYIPPWSLVVLVIIAWITFLAIRVIRKRRQ